MDAIDHLVAITPGSPLDILRRRKPITRDGAQASYLALFAPGVFGGVSPLERAAIASFVATLHGDGAAQSFYGAGLPTDLAAAVDAEAARGAGPGPYGRFPAGPLSGEGLPGPVFATAGRAMVGERLAAALDYAHRLVLHPRDADPAVLGALQEAGWSTDDIVTVAQLIAFLTFQLRTAHGLRALAAA